MNDLLFIIFNLKTMNAAIRMLTPIALAAMGGTFSERSGIINIGLEGMILIGAFAGVLGSYITTNAWLGVLCAVIAGGILGFIFAIFTVSYKANHVVAGVGINIFSLGLTTWLMQIIWGSRGTSASVNGINIITIPVIKDIPYLGEMLGI
ncbi:MAG: ABC transporter permease, partial [Bacillota bacterium]